jgi:hypothetical protein
LEWGVEKQFGVLKALKVKTVIPVWSYSLVIFQVVTRVSKQHTDFTFSVLHTEHGNSYKNTRCHKTKTKILKEQPLEGIFGVTYVDNSKVGSYNDRQLLNAKRYDDIF